MYNSFAITAEDKDGKDEYIELQSSFFKVMLDNILNFFESGRLPFEKEQTMAVMSIRDALLEARNCPDEWVKIN